MRTRTWIRAVPIAAILAIGLSTAQINGRSLFTPAAEPAKFADSADVPEPGVTALLGAGLLALAALRRPR